MKCYRHGDVIIREVKSIPDKAEKRKGMTLAEGEVTGHSHQISKGVAAMFDYNEKTYLKVTSKIACLTHEEHHEIKLPKGDYEVIIQKDYTPKGWQKVVD